MNPCSRILCVMALAGALASAGCTERGPSRPADPKPAPDFSLAGLDGKSVKLSDHRGEVVLLDFWATWCEPCHDSIPVFESLHKRHGGKGFLVLGINVDGDAEFVPEFVRKMKMTYPVILDNDWKVMKAYKVRGIPNMFLVDKKGRLRKHWVGLDDDLERVMDAEVKKLLEEPT